jgi:hypothetical protein
MGNFLTQKQITKLGDKDWKPIINGAYIIIYKDDYDADTWEHYCTELHEDSDKEELYILAFGTK